MAAKIHAQIQRQISLSAGMEGQANRPSASLAPRLDLRGATLGYSEPESTPRPRSGLSLALSLGPKLMPRLGVALGFLA